MKKVDIRVEIDSSCNKDEVIIRTNKRTNLIDRIIGAIEQSIDSDPRQLAAYRGGSMVLLDEDEIIRVYTEKRKVVIGTEAGSYESRLPLRELETLLDNETFIRISRFEIINLDRVSSFDFSISGTIMVAFDNGDRTWVSRRYMPIIQQRLKRLQLRGRDEK